MKNIICFFLFYLFLAYNVSFAVDIIVNEDEWPCKKSHINNPKTSDFWIVGYSLRVLSMSAIRRF